LFHRNAHWAGCRQAFAEQIKGAAAASGVSGEPAAAALEASGERDASGDCEEEVFGGTTCSLPAGL
jgi:hypothetical protein